jgi:hypothetical protein
VAEDYGPRAVRFLGLIELTVPPLALRRSHPVAVLAATLGAVILGDLLVRLPDPRPGDRLVSGRPNAAARLAPR